MNASLDPIFVSIGTTGPDPVHDGMYALHATSFVEGEGAVDLFPPIECSPFAPGQAPESAPKWLADKGLSGKKLQGMESWKEVVPAFLVGLESRPVVVASDRESFLLRFRNLCPTAIPPTVLDLTGFAAFLHPRRLENNFEALYLAFCGEAAPSPPGPEELRRLLVALVQKHLERDQVLRQLFARGYEDLRLENASEQKDSWDWLHMVERLLDQPSCYSAGAQQELFFSRSEDGQFQADLEEAPMDADRILRERDPRFLEDYRHEFRDTDPRCSRLEDDAPLGEEGQRRMAAFFDLLPKQFQVDDAEARERPGQRALGNTVAETLGKHEFVIADAPTGTGKTLAYLGPLMLWAVEHDVRVCVSTYTRALQEQAYFREVPRALDLLEAAGLPRAELPKVSLLKGRANYICGRAILDAAPEPSSASMVARVTWLRLAMFYNEDPTADLDGFPLAPGMPCGNRAKMVSTASAMMNQVRALPNCCRGRSAMRCAAGVRTLRSERSHLVVTNHAFVLARPEQFGHVVFDECDHLHEVALSAKSYDIELDDVAKLASNLQQSRGRDRAPLILLDQLLERLATGDRGERLEGATKESHLHVQGLDAAAHETARQLRVFEDFRREEHGKRTREEAAFLLHEYLESGRGDELVTALKGLRESVDGLDSALRTVIEELGDVHLRQARKLRWALRRPLELLAHWREGLGLWLGGESEEGDFSEDLHFEVVTDQRRRPLLALKWLLPQKWLGDVYFPSLRNAALVSATSKIRGGFRSMKAYLGLDLLQQDTIDRLGTPVREFASPASFDADAALYCVPEDAPPYAYRGPDAETWLEYVEDVLLFLAERTQGRLLGLFTSRVLVRRVGERLAPRFRALGLPFYWQGMPGFRKEEIMRLFRAQKESVLFGLDTFWYGVDFPGPTCEYIVMPKLPYGAPDDYMIAQQARMGWGPQRNAIYLPKALAMFRQGCGRLLRNESDRGAVLLLDRRVLEKRHANFLKELPTGPDEWQLPEIVRAESEQCFARIFAHMRLGGELERRGLTPSFLKARGALRS
ncbi:MAG: ATP-dependent DNA helicase [Planctomycetota bacterium]|nr:ATP-dependent DNA helicase [Planctomycetota bacterium]